MLIGIYYLEKIHKKVSYFCERQKLTRIFFYDIVKTT